MERTYHLTRKLAFTEVSMTTIRTMITEEEEFLGITCSPKDVEPEPEPEPEHSGPRTGAYPGLGTTTLGQMEGASHPKKLHWKSCSIHFSLSAASTWIFDTFDKTHSVRVMLYVKGGGKQLQRNPDIV